MNRKRRLTVSWQQLGGAAALAALFAGVYYCAFWIRFDGQPPPEQFRRIGVTIAWVIAIKLVCFVWFQIDQGWKRLVTFHDLLKLSQATTVATVALVLCDFWFMPSLAIPRSVLLLDFGLTIAVVGAVRSATRVIQESGRLPFGSDPRKRVFIIGANNSGEALLRAIRRASDLPFRVVGFLRETAASEITSIDGIPVVGHVNDTCAMARCFGVDEVFITAGALPGKQVRQLVESARRHDVSVKVLPSYEQLLQGHVNLHPRRVSIEDLLRRDPVELDVHELREWIDGRVLMVTGSAGSIGAEISRQLCQFRPSKLVLVDRSETGQFFLKHELAQLAPNLEVEVCLADITDTHRIGKLLEHYRPEIIFHAAAYKHVDLMESNPGEAIKNIALATRLLADLAHEHGVESFVMISTDKAVNPTSVMGVCKRIAEMYVQSLAQSGGARFVTVRFGNVLDSSGSVLPIFRKQIADGGPVTVTHPDMQRFFMTIPEASQLVIQAGAMGQGGEIFVLDMGEPVRICDMARDMIRLSGLRVGEDIEIEFIGMRPGEKLCEELHLGGEKQMATSHPKILVNGCEASESKAIVFAMERLRQVVNAPPEYILQELQRIVPEFQSSADQKPRMAA